MKKALLVIVAIVVIIALTALVSYNGLVRAREEVNKQWSNVEVQYQARFDKIPNLVETVKGYAAHEAEVLENLTKLRSGFDENTTPSEYAELDQQLTTAINVAVEAYPDLKADALFLNLQDELSGIENRIGVARRDYNEAANTYNVRIRTLPTSLYAGMLGFEPVELFKAAAGTDTVPTVNFGDE